MEDTRAAEVRNALTDMSILLDRALSTVNWPQFRASRMPMLLDIRWNGLLVAIIRPKVQGTQMIYHIEVRKNHRGLWAPDADKESGVATFYTLCATTLAPAARMLMLYLCERNLNEVLSIDNTSFTLY